MRRELVIGSIALAALLGSYVAIRAQGPPGGPPPPLVLADVKFLPWNNTGLPRLPTDLGPDGPAPRRELKGLWDPARGGVGARGARGMPAPLTPWGEAKGKTHKSGDGIRMDSSSSNSIYGNYIGMNAAGGFSAHKPTNLGAETPTIVYTVGPI